MKARLAIPVAVIAVASIFAVYAALWRGVAVPAVVMPTLAGERLELAAMRGRVVLVSFWATSCAICLEEMPRLVAMRERFRGRGFDIVAVAMQYDPPNHVARYVERTGLPLTVVFDPQGEIARAFGDVRYTPTAVLLDRDGRVVKRYAGAPDFAELEAFIESRLGPRT